jgi:SAM-dependent methyltransferase
MADSYDYWKRKNAYYYSYIKNFYKQNIPAGSSVLEFGCASGDILASSDPARGLGIDISEKLLALAKNKYPQYEFRKAAVENFSNSNKENFDYCIMSDLLDHLCDIPQAIESAYNILKPNGKLIINTINPLWNPVFEISERLKLKMPEGPHCFIPNRFIEFYCRIKGFKIISKGALIFIPKKIPLFSNPLNKIVPLIPFFNKFCWVQTLIARKEEKPKNILSYSVIIPAYNEEKNIEECIRRIPNLARDYEIIVVDDGSKDTTADILERLKKEIKNLKTIRLPQNRGKASAIEEGLRCAEKEVIIILDADMAVAPEYIPLFLETLERGLVRFVNGTRLIYNMEKRAMAQIKMIANFLLALFFSFVLRLRVTDTLCGTKAFFRSDFQNIRLSGEKWGDLVLLFHAKRMKLPLGEVPVRYYARKFGKSKMRFFSDGIKFLIFSLKIAFYDGA